MAGENYVNTASVATTAAPVGPSDTTAALASFSGWPSQPFYGEFDKDTASAEIVRVTNVAGSTITMTRGQGGTAATSHGAGVTFEHIVPADPFNRFEVHQAATNAHGVTGVVVGTTGAQTVADKLFRGAIKSQHTDALPAGISASVETVADNAGARDGHVHRNTAGHVDRRGFLLEQSGTPRFQAFNDGTVDIAPGASARPGFRNHGTTTLDGATTANAAVTVTAGGASVTGGLTVPTGAVTVTAGGLTVTAGGLTVSSGTTAVQAATATTISASSTVHAGGNLDTDANLIVDGTSTLTGTASTGGALNVGTTAAVTQGITSWGGRVVMSTAGTAGVTTPIAGDVVWDRTAKLWKEWTGAAWAAFAVPYAFLRQTSAQSVTSANFTALNFTTEDFDNVSGHSTVSNTSRYTCVSGFEGVYELAGLVSWATNLAGSRTTRWAKNGSVINASQGSGFDAGATGLVAARTLMVRLTAGDFVELEAYQSSGGSLNTNVSAEFQSSMSVKWIAP